MERVCVSVKEASEMSGFAEYTIREWLKAGDIPGAIKCGKFWRLPLDWMKRKEGSYADIQEDTSVPYVYDQARKAREMAQASR